MYSSSSSSSVTLRPFSETFATGSLYTAGGVCEKLAVNSLATTVNFWAKDPLMNALSSGATQWGDLLLPTQSAPVARIQYAAPSFAPVAAPIPAVQFDAPFEDMYFFPRISNPYDDMWDTSRLTCNERLQFYTWASVNGWTVTDVTADSCMAGADVALDLAAGQEETTPLYRISPEEVEFVDKSQRKAAAEARQLEITERKAALAAEGKPVNRAERRAAEKAAKDAAAAAAAAAIVA